MRKLFWQYSTLVLALGFCLKAGAQEPWTWEKVRQQFESNNPTLRAGSLNVDEARANEITANLRPNPTLSWDTQFFPLFNPGEFNTSYLENQAQFDVGIGYLFERGGKRKRDRKCDQDEIAGHGFLRSGLVRPNHSSHPEPRRRRGIWVVDLRATPQIPRARSLP